MGACCETEEEAQRLTTEHTLTRHRADVQEIRKSDYTLVTSSSVPALPIISPLPVPQRDRTLNSYLADSMPGSFQEASYLAPTAMEEELERYEAVVNNTIQVSTFSETSGFSKFQASYFAVLTMPSSGLPVPTFPFCILMSYPV